MSGGVDSSVAAALLVEQGHHVSGVTLRLWDNTGDSGCCSVAEIDDARRVADQVGIDHWVWTFAEEFEARVVAPYAAAHAGGLTPNPCIECNRHLKFGRLLQRARQLGFDAVATGHHARVRDDGAGRVRLLRGADRAKDQSYVLYVLGQDTLSRCLFPVGEMTKDEVRSRAAAMALRTAAKPDSQDVCFVTTGGGRASFLAPRIDLHPGRVVDTAGATIGRVDAVELVTVGQRKGLGTGGGGARYALSVDPATGTVVAGDLGELHTDRVELGELAWTAGPVEGPACVARTHQPACVAGRHHVQAQSSAHGPAVDATVEGATVRFARPQRRVAPGQSVVLYCGDEVLGGGIAR